MESKLLEKINPKKFCTLLINEFEARKKRNPRYSLRAFAAQLDIHAACLSVILRGKRPLTPDLIGRFLKLLSLGADQIEKCLGLEKNIQERKSRLLALDTFAIISQWYHDPILDLMRLDDFVPEISWIAQVLEISPIEVSLAVERLERCEMIKRVSKNDWQLLEPNTDIFINDFTTTGLKKLQLEILEISKEKLEQCPVEQRYHSTMTLAINVEDIPEAKNMLREFRAKFSTTLENARKLNDVYELQIGFFPLTTINKKSKELYEKSN